MKDCCPRSKDPGQVPGLPVDPAGTDIAGNKNQISYGGVAEDIMYAIPDWDKGFEFNVDLAEVQTAGVDISAVKKIIIGIGDKDATEAYAARCW